MKPIKLTMSAFANYADVQTIDFKELQNRNIFLITGNTGAGKTTIFDAISYVLFNTASGNSRGVDSLRSDYADGSILTFVELEFELKGEVYKIRRSPEQYINKKRGDGVTKSVATAEFTIPSRERPITGVGKVTEAVTNILGVNSEQFRKIVMLPQGEFMKFLRASSSEKKQIFSEIFGTSIFNKIQEKLRLEAGDLKKKIDLDYKERETYIKGIKYREGSVLQSHVDKEEHDVETILSILKDSITEDKNEAISLLEKSKGFKEELDKIKAYIGKLEEDKKKLNGYNEALKLYNEIKEKEEAFKEMREKFPKFKKAQKIKVLEDEVLKIERDKILKEKVLLTYSEELKLQRDKEKRIKEILKEEEQREEERDRLKVKIENLKAMTSKVSKYDELKYRFKKQDVDSKEIEKIVDDEEKEVRKNDLRIKELDEFIDKNSNIEVIVSEIVKEGKDKGNNKNKLEGLKAEFLKVESLKKKHSEKSEKFLIIEKDGLFLKEKYENAERLFRKAQAGILANSLEENSPCPVCGSLDHPNKASMPKDILKEDEIEELKINFEKKDKEVKDELMKLTKLKGEIDSKEKSEAKNIYIGFKEELLENFLSLEFTEKIKNVDEVIERLEGERVKLLKTYKEEHIVETKFKECKAEVTKLREKNEKLRENLEKNRKNREIIVSERVSTEEQIKTIEGDIEERLRNTDSLRRETLEVNKILEKMIKNFEKAREDNNKIEKAISKSEEGIDVTNLDLEKLIKELGEAREKFLDRLKSEEIKEEEFKKLKVEAKLDDGGSYIDRLEERITAFKEELLKRETAYLEREKDYKVLDIKEDESLERIKLKKLEEQKNIETTEEENNKLREGIEGRYRNNEEAEKNIEGISHKIEGIEKKYKDVDHLAKVSRGEGSNKKKMEFETYILTSYFEEIIILANIRLQKMTSGRFELRRAEDVKGGGRKGLDLSVIDNNTGKERGINSLSGGESFKAALSIALALAEVIENSAGGVSIETMFIDEGFGTLDPSSLDSAINTLLDLQNTGRLVGVISHVAELKERIDARLEVSIKEDNRGSKAKFSIN